MNTEKYEQIIDELFRYEKQGRGRVLELCQLEIDGRTIPLVGFTNGNVALITARHHVEEAFGTDDTIYELIERGVEGITAVPVIDVGHYDETQRRIRKWFEDENYEDLGLHVYYAMKESNNTEYRYGKKDAPEWTKKIEELIKSSKILFDLHNTRGKYFFITQPVNNSKKDKIEEEIVKQLDSHIEMVEDNIVGFNFRFSQRKGFYHYDKSQSGDILTYAASLNVLNYALEIPAISYNREDGMPLLRNQYWNTRINAAIIKGAIKLLK